MNNYKVGDLIRLYPGLYGSQKNNPNQDFVLSNFLVGVITKLINFDMYEEIEVLVDGEVFCIPTSSDVNDKIKILE